MSYRVLARKWRPVKFEDVVGQGHVTRTLENALKSDRVPHAILFSGSRGVGKTSCARILAKALNCVEGPTANPCGKCLQCVEITQGRNIDVFEIDGASNNSVDQIREIRESVKFVPTAGKRKVYIIDEVHMLSTSAFNALLKTLEEPPDHVLFVFATTEPHKIPETIISRCQRFDFRRISQKDLVDALKRICIAEGVEVSPSFLVELSRQARGGMRDSLSLLDQVISFCGTQIDEADGLEVLGVAGQNQLIELFSATVEHRAEDVLNGLESLYKNGVDLEKFAHQFVQLVRDLLLIKVATNPGRFVDVGDSELTRMSSLIESLTPSDLQRILGTLLRHFDEMSQSSFPKVRLELALLEVCEQGRTLPLGDILQSLEDLALEPVSRTQSEKKKTENLTGEPRLGPFDGNARRDDAKFDAPSSAAARQTGLNSSPALNAQVSEAQASPNASRPEDVKIESPSSASSARSEQSTEIETSINEVAPDIFKPITEKWIAPDMLLAEDAAETAGGKKRPTKRKGGYDDFSSPPPKQLSEKQCPVLPVKPRHPGGIFETAETRPSQSEIPIDASDEEFKIFVKEIIAVQDGHPERYRELLNRMRANSAFLASELEQNSFIVHFDSSRIDIAFVETDTRLRDRAIQWFEAHLLFEEARGQVNALMCSEEDERVKKETVFGLKQKEAAALLLKRQHAAESHEAVTMTRDILNGEVIDILPRSK